MKPEMNKMQTTTLRKLKKGILTLAISFVTLIFFTATTGFSPIPSSSVPPTPTPSVQGELVINFTSQAPSGVYVVVTPTAEWADSHPTCSIDATIHSSRLAMDVTVSGQGSCISNDYQEMAVIEVKDKNGPDIGSYLIYTAAGGTTILFIDLE